MVQSTNSQFGLVNKSQLAVLTAFKFTSIFIIQAALIFTEQVCNENDFLECLTLASYFFQGLK